MILLGVGDKGRGLQNIVNIYKIWTQQSVDFLFALLDCNDVPLQLPEFIPRDYVFYRTYDGEFNLSFMINYGIRHGLEKSGAKYVQLIGNDCYPSSQDYLKTVLSFMKDYDLVVPRTVRVSEKHKLSCFENYREFVENHDVDDEQISNGLIFVKREVFFKLHGYDETYMLWGREDDDFVIRAKQAGFKVKVLEDPYIIHDYHDPIYTRKDFQSEYVQENLQINLMLRRMTIGKKLPIQRMPADWGLIDQPRPNLSLINQLKQRRKI